MFKFNYKFCLIISLYALLATGSPIIATEPAKQFATEKEINVPPTGEKGTLKQNICKNPTLCDSIEIDILDKLQGWKVPVYQPKIMVNNSKKDYVVSLNFGIVVADTLVSVINKDKAILLKCVDLMKEYAVRLSIPQALLDKHQTITAAATKADWQKLETLIYEFKDEVMSDLSRKNKKELESLALVSGGLEGLYIMAKSLDNNFSEERGQLLKDREFVNNLNKYLTPLNEELKKTQQVKAIIAALPAIDKIMRKPKSSIITRGDVREVIKITEPLRQTITQ